MLNTHAHIISNKKPWSGHAVDKNHTESTQIRTEVVLDPSAILNMFFTVGKLHLFVNCWRWQRAQLSLCDGQVGCQTEFHLVLEYIRIFRPSSTHVEAELVAALAGAGLLAALPEVVGARFLCLRCHGAELIDELVIALLRTARLARLCAAYLLAVYRLEVLREAHEDLRTAQVSEKERCVFLLSNFEG